MGLMKMLLMARLILTSLHTSILNIRQKSIE
jgi:hypothetical protein